MCVKTTNWYKIYVTRILKVWSVRGGKNRVKIVKASNVKDAEGKAKKKYPSCEIGRISQDSMEIDFYSKYKR